MRKSVISFILTLMMLFSVFPTSVFAASLPEIYKDSVSVRVGGIAKVNISYGDGASNANIVISNANIEAYISGNILYIEGYAEGTSFVTLNFDDGNSDSIKVNVVSRYDSVNEGNEIELKRGATKSIYIDLSAFDATKATISYDSDYVSVNKTSFTSSGYLKISGKSIGDSTLRIRYNTGDAEVYTVNVVNTYVDSENEESFSLYDDESLTYYIDLGQYNASRATISYDSNYVSVNKTSFYSNGSLVITAKQVGNTKVTVKYDSDNIEYLKLSIFEDSDSSYSESRVSVDSINIEKGESQYFYVYLGSDSSRANLTFTNSSYASVSSSVLYTDGRVKITGNNIGSTELKVSFDDGTRVYIPITVTSPNYIEPYAEVASTKLLKGEKTELELFMGSNNSYATVTLESAKNIKLGVSNYSKYQNTYTISSAKNKTVYIDLEALEYVDDTYIIVKYPEGKSFKINLSIVETKVENTKGRDKHGNNYILKEGIHANYDVLNMGYIAGYSNGYFGPLNNITREEFGVILSRILDYDGLIQSSDFIYDVTADWSKGSIAELVAMGAVSKNVAYRPKDYITRYEVAEMLYNILDLDSYSTVCPLSDVDSSLRGKMIAKCWNAGILAGYTDNTFKGDKNISRAEAVVLVNRIFYENMETSKTNIFPDVKNDYWAYSYIVKASKQ